MLDNYTQLKTEIDYLIKTHPESLSIIDYNNETVLMNEIKRNLTFAHEIIHYKEALPGFINSRGESALTHCFKSKVHGQTMKYLIKIVCHLIETNPELIYVVREHTTPLLMVFEADPTVRSIIFGRITEEIHTSFLPGYNSFHLFTLESYLTYQYLDGNNALMYAITHSCVSFLYFLMINVPESLKCVNKEGNTL